MKYIKSNFHVEDVNLQKLAKNLTHLFIAIHMKNLRKILLILNSILGN